MRRVVLAVVAALLVPLTASADNPITPAKDTAKHPNQSALQRTRHGSLRLVQVGADADWACLATPHSTDVHPAATVPLAVPYYTAVQFKGSNTGGWFCFSQTPNGTDIALDTTTGVITDSAAGAPDGAASCFYIPANGTYAEVLDPSHFAHSTLSVLRRTDVCETAGNVEHSPGRPCRVDLDCAGTGSSTDICDLTPDSVLIGSAYVCGQSTAVSSIELDVHGTPSG